MNIREALLQQSPSLTLQRAAGDEIAKQDAVIVTLQQAVAILEDEVRSLVKLWGEQSAE